MGDHPSDVDDASGQVLAQIAGSESSGRQSGAHVAERVLPRGESRRIDIGTHTLRLR